MMPIVAFVCAHAVAISPTMLRCEPVNIAGASEGSVVRLSLPIDRHWTREQLGSLVAAGNVICEARAADPKRDATVVFDGDGHLVASCQIDGQDLGADPHQVPQIAR